MGRGFRSWGTGGKSGSNRRVINAVRVVMPDGVVADSKLEAYMYGKLLSAGIEFRYRPRVILQEGFKWRGVSIRAIYWQPDFVFDWCDIVVDTKGYMTEVAGLKLKIWKHSHRESGLYLPKNRDEVDGVFMYILAHWVKRKRDLLCAIGKEPSDE
jgi:hypothetical protein